MKDSLLVLNVRPRQQMILGGLPVCTLLLVFLIRSSFAIRSAPDEAQSFNC